MALMTIAVREGETILYEKTLSGPVEVGRQQFDEPGPFAVVAHGAEYRLIVANSETRMTPRRMIRLTCDDQSIKVENIHEWMVFQLKQGPLKPVAVQSTTEPIQIPLPDGKTLCAQIAPSKAESNSNARPPAEYRRIDTIAPGPTIHNASQTAHVIGLLNAGSLGTRNRKQIFELLRSTLEVVEQSAGSSEFFESAVKAAAESLNLDRALVLLEEDHRWLTSAEYSGGEIVPATDRWSVTLVDCVVTEGRTVIYNPSSKLLGSGPPGRSLANIRWAVASPILNEQRTVVGVLYGERSLLTTPESPGISDIEASLFEVLASAVAGGLARRREAQARAQLEQFFSARVTDELRTDPNLLEGRDSAVTVLFCDVRGFSTVTSKLGPKKAIEWINDVLTELSQCVLNFDGVLVDYVGDELFAMWGAPGNQPDHAVRALSTFIAMSDCMAPLRERWNSQLAYPFGVGIGLNTGIARVGNTGSRLKFKYGPLGDTVNVGSRVQGATRHFQVEALATETTVKESACEDRARRLGMTRMVGIDDPIMVYELVSHVTDSWTELRDRYCNALKHFEMAEFREAAAELGTLAKAFPDDGPTLLLLNRVVTELVRPSSKFSSILDLVSK